MKIAPPQHEELVAPLVLGIMCIGRGSGICP